MKFISALWLFIVYIRPILTWAVSVIHDGKVEPHEVQAAVTQFWPKRDDLTDAPLPVYLPWGKKP